ncbi:lipoprotein N-acyltransferase Lnb domain-containing protein [Tenacibaculum jejuense]|uniref:Uncharacterized protein n=1 Tax=Tenacibaculum jejuense TaxID=584609 RepID=A0A238U9L3_9FLAO|nr:DUF4105 domain-containing protein [Tenacibaculum jejuense]SNR15686.1 conserved membrane protein of unknown function [Tenacibaculum jejuense]
MKKLLALSFLFSIFFSYSQIAQLSAYAEISIITSGPGDHLYEKFGHTAVRVKDPMLNIDLLYNYGIFDFNGPDFYVNFVRGYMKYKLQRYPFHYSLKSANKDKRWVKQQVLNLTQEQKNAYFKFLETNAKPENASYFYDPFFDNCATRPKDILKDILKDNLTFDTSILEQKRSLRDLMNEKINPNTWGSFGINIALGSKLDKIADVEGYMYLPEYLFSIFEKSTIVKKGENTTLIRDTKTLLDFKTKKSKADSISPFLVFTVLFFIILFISYNDIKRGKRSKILDFLVLFITGLVGVLIVFLWFFTNHSTAPNNFNFLWAFAPNLIIAFFITKDEIKPWINKYLTILLVFLALIPLSHLFGVQKFTYPLYPLILLLVARYIFLIKFQKNKA